MDSRYYKALESRFQSRIDEAEANLSLYLNSNNLAAIGEHSDLMEEQEKWLGVLADSKDKLETLKEFKKNYN